MEPVAPVAKYQAMHSGDVPTAPEGKRSEIQTVSGAEKMGHFSPFTPSDENHHSDPEPIAGRIDPDLTRIIGAWAELSPKVRAAVVKLVEGTAKAGRIK